MTPVASLKFPPVTQLSYSSTRSKDWDDVLTAHKQETIARTWSVRDKKLGKWVLNPNDAGTPKEREKRKKKAFLGSVRVRHSLRIHMCRKGVGLADTALSEGRLRLSLRQLRLYRYFNRRNSDVQHAIWYVAEEV